MKNYENMLKIIGKNGNHSLYPSKRWSYRGRPDKTRTKFSIQARCLVRELMIGPLDSGALVR